MTKLSLGENNTFLERFLLAARSMFVCPCGSLNLLSLIIFALLPDQSSFSVKERRTELLYLYILKQNQIPTQKLMQRVLDNYRKSHGSDVRMLGGQRVAGSFPPSPDEYVVMTCFKVCDQNNLAFNSQNDRIAYSVDLADGEEIGVCQIEIK